MTRRQKTTFTPQVDGLEQREVLSTVVIHPQIPYVFAPRGVNQFAVNFTSNTFHQVLTSLNADAVSFARSGNLTRFETQLQALSKRVPFGQQVLLSTWLNDVSGATAADAGTVRSQLQADLITYLDNNEGSAFNVLKSGFNFSTDALLTYNGKVGRNPRLPQQTVIGVTPM